MKRIFCTILALLIAFSCFSLSASAIRKKYTVDENASRWVIASEKTTESDPKRTETTAYQYDSNGRIITKTGTVVSKDYNGWSNETFKYDSRGRITRSDFNMLDGPEGTSRYKYDSKGRITFCDFSGTGYESYSYSYDSDGRLSKQKRDSNDGEILTTKYTYSSDGLLVKSKTYNNGKIFYTTSYKYNSDSLLSSQKTVYYEIPNYVLSVVSVKSSYKYDSKGNLIKETFKTDYKNEKDISESINYKYDSNGNLLKKVYNDGSGFYDIYTYNKNGKITKEKHNDDFNGKSEITYKYDSNGNIKKKVYKSSGNVKTTEYTYIKLSKSVFKTYNGITLEKCNYNYDGKAKKPLVFIEGLENYVYDYPKTSFLGPDFTVKYSDNVNPGKAKVKVKFVNPENPELFGKTITLTFNILPEKVKNIKAAKIGKDSVTLTWSKVPNAQKYIVYSYYDATGKYEDNGKAKVAVVKTNKAVIKDLSAGTAYRFTVKAVVGGVTGQAGNDVKLKTSK